MEEYYGDESELDRGEIGGSELIEQLAIDYPVLYLNPDVNDLATYRRVVLYGDDPPEMTLGHYCGDSRDKIENIELSVGTVRVVTVGNRQDFELIVKNFMALTKGLNYHIPKSQGAAMFTVFNWGRIHSYVESFDESMRTIQYKIFTSKKSNYLDRIIVLSWGPYSSIPAELVGESSEQWLKMSHIIRRDHELTHVICRILYPENVEPIRDELVADAVGLYSAFGYYDINIAKAFLGIKGTEYIGGRLGIYSDKPQIDAKKVSLKIDEIRRVVDEVEPVQAFDLIANLMTIEW